RTEAQAVEQGDGTRAHREDIADDAADAGGRPLKRLDGGGMVMALHLEGQPQPGAEVDDPGVLPRPLQDARMTGGGEQAEDALRALVATVLGPHHAEDADLDVVRRAAQDRVNALILIVGQPHLAVEAARAYLLRRWLRRRALRALVGHL